MCSVQDADTTVPEIRQNCESRNCMKCVAAAVVVIRVNDPLCRECFLSYCVHKFRMSFGKSKLIRDREHVVLAFSGGSSSSGMLHLVLEGKSERAKKKLRFVPLLIHIDESAIVADNTECEEKVLAKMKSTGLMYQVYRLEQIFDPALSAVEQSMHTDNDEAQTMRLEDVHIGASGTEEISPGTGSCVKSAKERLSDLFKSAKTLSAKQALLLNTRLHLLARIAMEVGVNKVLLGDTGTRLAIRMLSDITQGRGAHLPFEMSFADTRREDVTYVRPMREFTNKEVAMYNVLNKVDTVFIPNFSTKAPSNSSIEQLTEQFVTGLQAEFPNTVSTVFRTGEKLDLSHRKQSTEEDNKCALCQAPLDIDVAQCSALNATVFSQKLCTQQSPGSSSRLARESAHCEESPTANDTGVQVEQKVDGASESQEGAETGCCGNGDGSCHTVTTRVNLEELNSALCYGCRLVVKDLESHEKLPEYILENAARQIRRKNMKQSIVDFLIEDSEG